MCHLLLVTLWFCDYSSFIDYQGPDVPQPNFFTPAQRSRMVHEVLLRTRYGDEQQQFGRNHSLQFSSNNFSYLFNLQNFKFALSFSV